MSQHLDANPSRVDINALSDQIATVSYGTITFETFQNNLVTLNGTLSDYQFKNVRVTFSDAVAPFLATAYFGTIRRHNATRFNVEMQGISGAHHVVTGIYNAGTWDWYRNGYSESFTPKLYDNDVYKRDIGTGKFFRIGNFVVVSIVANNPDFSNISTLIAFRDFPMNVTFFGGTCYIAQLAKPDGSFNRPIVVQGGNNYLFLRPNIKSSDFEDATKPGTVEIVGFGYV